MLQDLLFHDNGLILPPSPIFDATWNPAHLVEGSSLSLDNLTLSESTGKSFRVLTTKSRSEGKAYWELVVTLGSYGDAWVGVAPEGSSYKNPLNGPAGAYWRDEGQYVRNGGWVGGVTNFAYANNLTLRFAYDAATRRLWISKEEAWLGGGDPANDYNPFAILVGTYPITPIYTTDGRAGNNIITANFGGSSFKYPVPNGFDAGF